MPEMHLIQLRFTYTACGPFTKNKERIQKFKGTGDSRHIYQNKLEKACFQHDMTYEDLKDLSRFKNTFLIKHLILPKIQNMMNINVNLLQWSIAVISY